jgi:hypothetical protein
LPFVTIAVAVSCGSRTGLIVDPVDDASVADVTTERDAQPDRFDAEPDVIDDGPKACVPGTFRFDLAVPQLMFVIDRSGSMAYRLDREDPAPPGAPNRWTTLRDGLAQTIVPLSAQLAIGARFFPSRNAGGADPNAACAQDPGTGIAPATGNAARILDVFSQTRPIGGTPTAVAIELAAQQLSASRAVARVMVLATDGAPNCNAALNGNTCNCTLQDPDGCKVDPPGALACLDDTKSIATVTDIFSKRKIPVYVIGIGATQSFASVLDAMAVAGGRPRAGTPRYYDVDTPAEMTAALTDVRDSVARCTYISPSAPDDPSAVSVVVAGKEVPYDPTHVEGWDWIDKDYGVLQLFGTACGTATSGNVSGTIGCKGERD